MDLLKFKQPSRFVHNCLRRKAQIELVELVRDAGVSFYDDSAPISLHRGDDHFRSLSGLPSFVILPDEIACAGTETAVTAY
ncbi:MAG: hypothetical protein ACRD3N_13095 [Terracidiphilus sp.]